MQSKIAFNLKRLSSRLSVRAGIFAVFAICSALIAVAFSDYVPEEMNKVVGGKAVDSILAIIASSMLAVVTFSLSVMVSSYANASSTATPRATKLLMEDTRAQNALSIFLGAFIYSIVALVALSTGYYGPEGRVILFIMTAVILLMIVWTIIRWIDHLSNLGRVGETIRRLEEVSTKAFIKMACAPTSGCRLYNEMPTHLIPVLSNHVGFLQTISLEDLATRLKNMDHETSLYIAINVGNFVDTALPIAFIKPGSKKITTDFLNEVRSDFIIGNQRTFEDDPEYGLTVLSEVATKALSSAINDPGTANDVLVAMVRVITKWQQHEPQAEEQKHDNIFCRCLNIQRTLDNIFDPIARDGAGYVEVATRLQMAFRSLYSLRNEAIAAAALALSKRSLERSKKVMNNEDDFIRVKELCVESTLKLR